MFFAVKLSLPLLLDYSLCNHADDPELWQGAVEVFMSSCYVNLMKAIGGLVQDANVAGVRPRTTAEGEEVTGEAACLGGQSWRGVGMCQHGQGDCASAI